MLEDAAEALLAPHLTYRGRIERAMSSSLDRRPEREHRVRALPVVVVSKLADQVIPMARAQHHEAVQAFALQGEDESLREGVQVGAPRAVLLQT